MKTLVITNEKGGTGKSTVAVLLVEYLNWKKQPVQLNNQVIGDIFIGMFNSGD